MIGYATLGTNDIGKARAFYGAYFCDLDGNELCASRVGAAS